MCTVTAVFEIWAAAGTPPWPTVSATVGHLEAQWTFVSLIVVAVIVVAAARALTYPWPKTGPILRQPNRDSLARTKTGRITLNPRDSADDFDELSPYLYLTISLAVVDKHGTGRRRDRNDAEGYHK